ncbi:MAG: TA system VapC family ribonuclease toxin [Acidobacteriota bacterium]
MSFALDVNLLLYAANTGCAEHERALRFLTACAEGDETVCLAWPTLQAFLRISTHPAIFPHPLSWTQAVRALDALLSLPHVHPISELEGFWAVLQETAGALLPRGNLVPDAHLAAILRQNGVRVLYTCDRDFRRFSFLEVRDPLG